MPVTNFQFGLAVGARTEQGHRAENQDQMTGFSCPAGYIYLVADGMGGHLGGLDASHIVAEVYRQQLAGLTSEDPWPKALQQATAAVHAELLRVGSAADSTTRGMGSTVVLLALFGSAAGQQFLTGHVGDSRVYFFRQGRLRRLTGDHSMVQRMVDENLLTQEEARSHPQSNILTRALGQHSAELEVSAPEAVEVGDLFLLCTDGLWGALPDETLSKFLSAQLGSGEDLNALSHRLVELALARGSEDNITVQLISIGEPAERRTAQTPAASIAGRPVLSRRSLVLSAALTGAMLVGAGAWLVSVRGWVALHQHTPGTPVAAPVTATPRSAQPRTAKPSAEVSPSARREGERQQQRTTTNSKLADRRSQP